MKRSLIIFTLIVALASLDGFASSSAIDVAWQKAPGENPYALLKKAEALYQKDTRQALDLIEEALLIALRQNNLPAQGESYKLLGEINSYLKQYDLAAANYQRALALFKKTNDRNKILELLKLSGRAYEQAEDYPKALSHYEEFLKMVEKPTKSKLEYSNERSQKSASGRLKENSSLNEAEEVRLAISEIYAKQRKFDMSVKNLKVIASQTDTLESPDKHLILNDKLGDVYKEQDMEDEAIGYYTKNVNTARRLNKPEEEGKANTKMAEILADKKQEEEALKLRNRSIEIYNISKDTANLARQYLEKGRLLNSLNQFQQSEAAFITALNLAKSSSEKQVERKSYREIAALEEKQGQLRNALESYKRYVALQDETYKEKERELESKLELNASLNQQQQRMDLLEKNEEINNSTIEILRANETIAQKSATNQRLIIYGLLLLILLLGISGYLMVKNMKRRRIANQMLALKSLRAQMNPHFIFNALNSVNHYISQKDERAANKYLSEFSRLMRVVLENSQEDFITLDKELEIMMLYLKLEHNRFKEKFDYTLHIDENLDRESIKLPPMMIQPYVENAIWHGLRYRETKGNLRVQYLKKESLLQIVIEDDGIGREKSEALKTDNQKKNNSTGMSNIENRVHIVNEMYSTHLSVEISDLSQNGGTRVELNIPIMNHQTIR